MSERVLVKPENMAGRWGYATVATFMQAVRRRGIPVVRIGRSVRFDPAECDRWLEKQNPRAGRPMPRAARSAAAHLKTLSHAPQRNGVIGRVPREPEQEIRAAVGGA